MAAVAKPAIPGSLNQKFVDAVKENIETISGRRAGIKKIEKLASTATLTDAINKVNEILDRLQ